MPFADRETERCRERGTEQQKAQSILDQFADAHTDLNHGEHGEVLGKKVLFFPVLPVVEFPRQAIEIRP